MILVTGATGHFGRRTIEFLLKKGVSASNISALVRDSAKAEDLKANGVTIKQETTMTIIHSLRLSRAQTNYFLFLGAMW